MHTSTSTQTRPSAAQAKPSTVDTCTGALELAEGALLQARRAAAEAETALGQARAAAAGNPDSAHIQLVSDAEAEFRRAQISIEAHQGHVSACRRALADARRGAALATMRDAEQRAEAHRAALPQLLADLVGAYRTAAAVVKRIEDAVDAHDLETRRALDLAGELGVDCSVEEITVDVARTAATLHLADHFDGADAGDSPLGIEHTDLLRAVRQLPSALERGRLAPIAAAVSAVQAALASATGGNVADWLTLSEGPSWGSVGPSRQTHEQAERLLDELIGTPAEERERA